MFDVLIVGGGLVGSSLACALQNRGFNIGLIEAKPWASGTQPAVQYDDRVIALSYSSRNIFKGLGLWSKIAPQATPIRQIHVSDRGHFGFARLNGEALRLDALGYVIEAKVLGHVLQQDINQAQQVQVFASARIKAVHSHPTSNTVELEQADSSQTLHTRWLVVADGSHSPLCQQLGLSTQRYDYGQTAIIANVTPSQPHQHQAYERFTDTGPLALLPMREQRCSLVWTVKDTQVDSLLRLSKPAFLHALQQRFGWRLGRFTQVGQRHAYPLSLLTLQSPLQKALVVIGNAAHTLHPVGGQGFNLGLRDVSALAQTLCDKQQLDPSALLQHYVALRSADQQRTIQLTHTLVQLFSNHRLELSLIRDLGVLGLDQIAPLKQSFTQQMAGLGRQAARLDVAQPL